MNVTDTMITINCFAKLQFEFKLLLTLECTHLTGVHTCEGTSINVIFRLVVLHFLKSSQNTTIYFLFFIGFVVNKFHQYLYENISQFCLIINRCSIYSVKDDLFLQWHLQGYNVGLSPFVPTVTPLFIVLASCKAMQMPLVVYLCH